MLETSTEDRVILYGDTEVPLLRRPWPVVTRKPYRKTYALKPGEKWKDAPETEKQWETYVGDDNLGYIPVGAKIGRELCKCGATIAGLIELWHGVVVVNHELICTEPPKELVDTFEVVRSKNGGRLQGFPDAFGIFHDGRLALVEAKCHTTKDRLGKAQHKVANILRDHYGDLLYLAVVEWGPIEV